MVHARGHSLSLMVQTREYKDRFAEAMRLSGKDVHGVAEAVDVSYQAVKKVLNGTTKMLKADHNVVAAHAMAVDSEWLATGKGQARGRRVWPLSPELLDALHAADAQEVRRAENAARNVLNMDPLPRELTPPKPDEVNLNPADRRQLQAFEAELEPGEPPAPKGKSAAEARGAPSRRGGSRQPA